MGSLQFYFYCLWGLQFNLWSSSSALPRHVSLTPFWVSTTKDYSASRTAAGCVGLWAKKGRGGFLPVSERKRLKSWIKHLENYCSLTAFAACYPGWVITGCHGNSYFPPADDPFCLREGSLKPGAAQINATKSQKLLSKSTCILNMLVLGLKEGEESSQGRRAETANTWFYSICIPLPDRRG